MRPSVLARSSAALSRTITVAAKGSAKRQGGNRRSPLVFIRNASVDAYSGRVKTVLSRIASLQDAVDEKNAQWRQVIRDGVVAAETKGADARTKLVVAGEDFTGKSVVIRSLLDDDTVDQDTSDFLAKTMSELAVPTRIVYGDRPEFTPPGPSSQFAFLKTPTKWLNYCSSEVIFLPGLYNFDVSPNKSILETALIEADAVLLVSDVSRQLTGAREINILEMLQKLGRADRVVLCVNQTDRLDNEAVGIAGMSKEIAHRVKAHAPSMNSPIFYIAAKRALVAPVGLRTAVGEGEPVQPLSYQARMAAARVDVLREHLLGKMLNPTNRAATKNMTNLSAGEFALGRLEREIDVAYKTIQSYHGEITRLTDAIRREETRVVDDASKKTGSEIARVLAESEEATMAYVDTRSLWRFLWRMEPISLEATRRLMGSTLVHLNNADGGTTGFTWEGVQNLREVEMRFSHAIGRTDGIMTTLGDQLRTLLGRIAQSKALNRHQLSKELETEIARLVELLDRELEMSGGMNPVKVVSGPVAEYEAKVKRQGDYLQNTGDSTVLTTVGFEIGTVLAALFATHLGYPLLITASSGFVLATCGLLWMNGRWRSLKYNYSTNINEHGRQLRLSLVDNLKQEMDRVYGKRFEELIGMYQHAHGKVLNKIDERAYEVREELRVARNILAELKKM